MADTCGKVLTSPGRKERRIAAATAAETRAPIVATAAGDPYFTLTRGPSWQVPLRVVARGNRSTLGGECSKAHRTRQHSETGRLHRGRYRCELSQRYTRVGLNNSGLEACTNGRGDHHVLLGVWGIAVTEQGRSDGILLPPPDGQNVDRPRAWVEKG